MSRVPRTTIALPAETAVKLNSLAKEKGISQGFYVQKMIEFFETNSIDYSNGDVLLGALVRKEIERVIKILRAYEKEYFKSDSTKLGNLEGALLNVLQEAQTEISDVKMQSENDLKSKFSDLNNSYHNFKREVGLSCQTWEGIINRAEKNRKGYEIQLSENEKVELDNILSKIYKEIYN